MTLPHLSKTFSLLVIVAALNGCAVMSKTECLNADWNQVGYDVGFDGEVDSSVAFTKRADICADYGTVADARAFQTGYEEGIENYCAVSNAVVLGTRGQRKAITNQVCPETEFPGFTSAFNAGYKLFVLQGEANNLGYEIDRLLEDKYRYQRRRQELRYQIESGQLSDRERQNAIVYRRQLKRDIHEIRSRVYHYRGRLVEQQSAADTYAELLRLEYSDDLY